MKRGESSAGWQDGLYAMQGIVKEAIRRPQGSALLHESGAFRDSLQYEGEKALPDGRMGCMLCRHCEGSETASIRWCGTFCWRWW